MAYRHRGELHRVQVHGQDARGVSGTTPTSLAKVLLVIGIVIAVIAAIALASS